MGAYRLFTSPGCGSMIVELAAAIADVPLECIDLAWEETGWDSASLRGINPTGQVPTLILPDGAVMTESAAIILHFADIAPQAGLAPAPGDGDRPAFLRWLVTLVAAIYPTFTYGDRPERWVPGHADAEQALTDACIDHRKTLYRTVEAAAGAPYFLGARLSAIDLYLWAMSHWRPRQAWFAAETPKLFAIAQKIAALPEAKAVNVRNGLPDA